MAVKFDTNLPKTLYFPFGDAVPKEGKGGIQMMYTVNLDSKTGEKNWLYASETLNQILSKLPLKGQAVTITKKEQGKKNYWEVRFGTATFSSLEPPPGDTPPTPTEPPDFIEAPQRQMVETRTNQAVSVADMTLSLKECLEGAEWAWSEAMVNFRNPVNPTSEDIRALAATLFIKLHK